MSGRHARHAGRRPHQQNPHESWCFGAFFYTYSREPPAYSLQLAIEELEHIANRRQQAAAANAQTGKGRRKGKGRRQEAPVRPPPGDAEASVVVAVLAALRLATSISRETTLHQFMRSIAAANSGFTPQSSSVATPVLSAEGGEDELALAKELKGGAEPPPLLGDEPHPGDSARLLDHLPMILGDLAPHACCLPEVPLVLEQAQLVQPFSIMVLERLGHASRALVPEQLLGNAPTVDDVNYVCSLSKTYQQCCETFGGDPWSTPHFWNEFHTMAQCWQMLSESTQDKHVKKQLVLAEGYLHDCGHDAERKTNWLHSLSEILTVSRASHVLTALSRFSKKWSIAWEGLDETLVQWHLDGWLRWFVSKNMVDCREMAGGHMTLQFKLLGSDGTRALAHSQLIGHLLRPPNFVDQDTREQFLATAVLASDLWDRAAAIGRPTWRQVFAEEFPGQKANEASAAQRAAASEARLASLLADEVVRSAAIVVGAELEHVRSRAGSRGTEGELGSPLRSPARRKGRNSRGYRGSTAAGAAGSPDAPESPEQQQQNTLITLGSVGVTRIVVVTSGNDATRFVASITTNDFVVGVDGEWVPQGYGGDVGCAVLQVARRCGEVYLFDLASRGVRAAVARLLSAPRLWKVHHAFRSDWKMLRMRDETAFVECGPCVDVCRVVEREQQCCVYGLAAACAVAFPGLEMGKEQMLGNWEVRPWRRQQVEYAALDAAATLQAALHTSGVSSAAEVHWSWRELGHRFNQFD